MIDDFPKALLVGFGSVLALGRLWINGWPASSQDAMKLPWRASAGAVLLLVQGCASTAFSPADLARLEGKREIRIVHHPPRVSLAIITKEDSTEARSHVVFVGPTFGALGFIGFRQMISGGGSDRDKAQAAGEQILREYGIDDPVLRVQAHAVEMLARDTDSGNLRPLPTVVPSEKWGAMRQMLGDGVVIDFETITWGVFPHSFDPSRSVVAYRARARLLILGENKVLWEAECPVPRRVRGLKSSLDVKSLPTLEQLLADGGAALKAQFEKQADSCAEDLIGEFTRKPAVTEPSAR